jgi:hypothetical protein
MTIAAALRQLHITIVDHISTAHKDMYITTYSKWDRGSIFLHKLYCTGCATSPATLLLRVVSQLSVDQYCSDWAHFKALFVLYTFDNL